MCWCICTVASFVRGSRQFLQGGGAARDDFVFQSGPRSVSEIKHCEFIKFEFSKEGADSRPPLPLNPRMKRTHHARRLAFC